MLLRLLLRSTAPVLVVIGALHLFLGLQASGGLGAQLPAVIDPVLDSQDRFYGVAFTLYAAVFWIGAGDPQRYAPILGWAIGLFFAGGLGRLLAWSQHGSPGPVVLVLLGLELLLPPLFAGSLRAALATKPSTSPKT